MQNNQSVDDDDDYDDAPWLASFDESIKKQMGNFHLYFPFEDIMYSRRHFSLRGWMKLDYFYLFCPCWITKSFILKLKKLFSKNGLGAGAGRSE